MNDVSIQEIISRAKRLCEMRGGKLTAKRQKVLTILLQAEKAISAYELIDHFSEQFDEALTPMSAYRILEFLESVHLAHKLNIANKYVACNQINETVKHTFPQLLFCDKCQKVDEIAMPITSLETISQTLHSNGFMLSSPQLEMACICHQCSNE